LEFDGMRLLLELNSVDRSVTGNGRTQIRLTGLDKNGRNSRAIAYGYTADNILKSLYKIVSPTDDLKDHSVTIDLHGGWKNGKEYERDGKKFTFRYFEIEQFQFLLGPALELQKIRQDSLAAFHRAEAARAEGDFRSAYRELLEQTGKTCNMIDEVSEILESLNQYEDLPDDMELTAIEEQFSSPEALALKKFSSMNGIEDVMELAANSPQEEIASDETSDHVSEDMVADQDDDYVFGEIVDETSDENNPAVEGDIEQSDVLDDEPASDAENKASGPAKPAPAFSSKPSSGFGRPSGGFGRPSGFGRPG
jgi:hypothetical protein